jgi:hypothetical protein
MKIGNSSLQNAVSGCCACKKAARWLVHFNSSGFSIYNLTKCKRYSRHLLGVRVFKRLLLLPLPLLLLLLPLFSPLHCLLLHALMLLWHRI